MTTRFPTVHIGIPGVTLSVTVRRDVPPFRPLLFTSGTPYGWVFRCQTYSCWVSFFFILSHSLWVIFVQFSYLATLLGLFLWKFDTPVGVKIYPADTLVGVKIHPTDPTPLPVSGRSAYVTLVSFVNWTKCDFFVIIHLFQLYIQYIQFNVSMIIFKLSNWAYFYQAGSVWCMHWESTEIKLPCQKIGSTLGTRTPTFRRHRGKTFI